MSDTGSVTYRCECDALAGVQIEIASLRLVEALDEPYVAELALEIGDPDADTAQMLGRDMVVTIARAGTERRFCGLVREVTLGEADPEMQEARVVVTPALQLASLRRNTRMFQEKDVKEILETVLGETLEPYGRSYSLSLDGTYEKREYCLQFQESDLDFVQRLMQEEGISYHFDHTGDVEEVVLTDANAAFEAAPTVDGGGAVSYQPHNLTARDEDPIHRFQTELADTTTAITVTGDDWTQSPPRFEAAAEGEDALGRVRESYEHGIGRQLRIGSYDEGVRRYQKNDAEAQAPLRQEAAVARAVVGRGISRAVGFAPGRTFTLSGHPSVGVDGDYLVTRAVHEKAAPPSETTAADTDPYHNRFECIPLDTVHRPERRTRKPRIDGVEPAIVTGPSGEEIHVDEHGRIKVHFHWDRENPEDETSSCWIRVKQEWAGASWGFWWVPRIGMEVMVHFVDGDPDRPLVTGGVYDGANATPYELPDEKTKSTIKSDSSLGHSGFSGHGFNELRFEDKAGSEEIYVHAEKDYNEVVENDHTTTVHHDQTNTVDNNQTQTIGNDQTERVDVDQSMTVGANRTVHVKGSFSETVDGTETRNTSGDVDETFDVNETRSIGASVTETIGGNEERTIGADQSEKVGANQVQTIGGNSDVKIGAGVSRSADGGITTTTPATQDVKLGGDWNITTTGALTIIAPGGSTLTIPGGVQRADSRWGTLVSTRQTEYGTIELETFQIKNGICLSFACGVWGIKIDLHVSESAINVTNMIIDGAKAKKRDALENAMKGAEIDFDATKIYP